jgi:hypothetical protein
MVQVSQTKGDLAKSAELIVKGQSPKRCRGLGEVNRLLRDGIMNLVGEGRAIVEEDSIEVARLPLLLLQMFTRHAVQIIGNLFRSSGALEESVTAQKEVTVEKDSRWHQKASKKSNPLGSATHALWIVGAYCQGVVVSFLS